VPRPRGSAAGFTRIRAQARLRAFTQHKTLLGLQWIRCKGKKSRPTHSRRCWVEFVFAS